MNWRMQVPSSGRPGNVPKLQQLLGVECDWYVPADQAADYRYAGAEHVFPVEHDGWHGRLAAQRNRMLDEAFADNRYSVQCDDDLRSIKWMAAVGAKPERIGCHDAIARVLAAMADTGALLGGRAITSNPLSYRRPLTTVGFVNGLLVVAPSPERFDETLVTKADWDYTLQHLHAYGGVARVDALLMDFPYRKGRGGCEDYRTQQLLEEGAAALLDKWPDAVKASPTKPGELRLTWKPPQR